MDGSKIFIRSLVRLGLMKQYLIICLAFLVIASCTKKVDVGCTLEAKICPDGSAVGRSGPNCEFAPCPPGNIDDTQKDNGNTELKGYCTPEQKQAKACTLEYAPVCGWFDESIQCIRYPCASTYTNIFHACADPKVAYYTAGECPQG